MSRPYTFTVSPSIPATPGCVKYFLSLGQRTTVDGTGHAGRDICPKLATPHMLQSTMSPAWGSYKAMIRGFQPTWLRSFSLPCWIGRGLPQESVGCVYHECSLSRSHVGQAGLVNCRGWLAPSSNVPRLPRRSWDCSGDSIGRGGVSLGLPCR